MPKYLISFNDGDMQFDREELPQVAEDAHAVMRDAIAQGVWVFGGGFEGFQTKVVNSRGDVSDGPLAPSDVVLGGFTVIDVADDDAAHEWAARIAKACRCDQEVRRFMDDPEQEELMS